MNCRTDAKLRQHRPVPARQPAEGRAARRPRRPQAAVRSGVQGVRRQIRQAGEGEEGPGEGGRAHPIGNHRRRSGGGARSRAQIVPAANVRGDSPARFIASRPLLPSAVKWAVDRPLAATNEVDAQLNLVSISLVTVSAESERDQDEEGRRTFAAPARVLPRSAQVS